MGSERSGFALLHIQSQTMPQLTVNQAARHLGISPSLLRKWRDSGQGPTYRRLAPRTIRYDLSELDRYREQMLVTPEEPRFRFRKSPEALVEAAEPAEQPAELQSVTEIFKGHMMRLNYSYADLARETGFSLTYVMQVVGGRRIGSYIFRRSICRIFDVQMEDLMSLEEAELIQFGQKVSQRMKADKIGLVEMAGVARVSAPHFRKILAGTRFPGRESVIRIADRFGVSPNELMKFKPRRRRLSWGHPPVQERAEAPVLTSSEGGSETVARLWSVVLEREVSAQQVDQCLSLARLV